MIYWIVALPRAVAFAGAVTVAFAGAVTVSFAGAVTVSFAGAVTVSATGVVSVLATGAATCSALPMLPRFATGFLACHAQHSSILDCWLLKRVGCGSSLLKRVGHPGALNRG